MIIYLKIMVSTSYINLKFKIKYKIDILIEENWKF